MPSLRPGLISLFCFIFVPSPFSSGRSQESITVSTKEVLNLAALSHPLKPALSFCFPGVELVSGLNHFSQFDFQGIEGEQPSEHPRPGSQELKKEAWPPDAP